MKTKSNLLKYKIRVLLGFLLFSLTAVSQGIEQNMTLEKSIKCSNNPSITIKTQDVKVVLLPAEGNNIKVEFEFDVFADDSLEIKKYKDFLQETLLVKNEGNFLINNNAAKKSTIVEYGKDEKRSRAKFTHNGTKIRLNAILWKELRIYLPKQANLHLNVFDGIVNLSFPLKGNMKITSFDANFYADSFLGKLIIEDGQVSKFEFGDLKSATITINDSKFSANTISDFEVDSKFSELQVANCNNLIYTGFEDEINMVQLKKAKIKSNYSELNLQHVEEIFGELLEGSLIMKSCNDAVLIGKYTEIEVENMGLLKLRNCVETEFRLHEVHTLISLYGGFNEYKIELLNNFFSTYQSTETDVNILKTAKDFSGIVLNGKFCDATINIDKNCSYTFNADVQFADIQLNDRLYRKELFEKELDDVKMIYHYGENKNKSDIKVNGFEHSIKLSHY